MKDTDKAIERWSQSLRDAEPASDFEQAIFAALRQAEQAQSAAAGKPWRLLPRLDWPAWTFACLLLLGVAWWVTAVHPRQRQAKLSSQHKIEHQTGRQTEIVRRSAPPPSALLQTMSRARKRATAVKSTPAHEQTAWRNSPAPPLPLTEQEKLLQRIARRRDAGNLALLNADQRNAQTAQATQQFQRFFVMNPEEMRNQLE